MKIENSKLSRTGGTRRRSGVNGTDGESFAAVFEEGNSPPPSLATTGGTASASSAADVGALLALQSADAEEGDAASRRAKTRADELLRKMDQLRVDLLNGGIPREHLISLAHATKTARDGVFDPRLVEILDEIDLRAQVELAKYTPSSSPR